MSDSNQMKLCLRCQFQPQRRRQSLRDGVDREAEVERENYLTSATEVMIIVVGGWRFECLLEADLNCLVQSVP